MSRTIRRFALDGYVGIRAGRDGPHGMNKGTGYDYWGRRPLRGCSPFKGAKKLTHQIERSRRRNLLHEIEYKESDKAYAELMAVAS